jgi:lactate permease
VCPFASVQFYVSNYMGPELTDIMSSLTCIAVMALFLKVWKPREIMRLEGEGAAMVEKKRFAPGQVFMAWLPYLLLVIAVLTLGEPRIKARVNTWTDGFLPIRCERNRLPIPHLPAA